MKTTKIYLAAALLSLGAGLDYVDKSDPRHMEFCLIYSAPFAEEDEWFERNLQEWENKTLTVNAVSYMDSLQRLKSEVHRA